MTTYSNTWSKEKLTKSEFMRMPEGAYLITDEGMEVGIPLIQERIESSIVRHFQWRRLAPVLARSKKFMLFESLDEMRRFIASSEKEITDQRRMRLNSIVCSRIYLRLQRRLERNSAGYLILIERDQLRRAVTRLGSSHPKVADLKFKLAMLHVEERQNYLAIPLLRQAIGVYAAKFGESDLRIARCQCSLAFALQKQRKFEEAIAASQAALAIFIHHHGETHDGVAQALSSLGLSYYKLGRFDEAEGFTRRSLKILLNLYGDEHPDSIMMLRNLATILVETGRFAKAEALLKRAIAAGEKALGPFDDDNSDCVKALADLYRSTGRQEEAEALMESVDAAQCELIDG